MATWLLRDKKEDGDDVAAVMVGLIVYGLPHEEELQNVRQTP